MCVCGLHVCCLLRIKELSDSTVPSLYMSQMKINGTDVFVMTL